MIHILILGLAFCGFVQAEEVKETVIRFTQRKINGDIFAHRVDITNGVLKEQRAINSKIVSAEVFEQAREEATRQEYLLERKKQEEKRLEQEAEEVKKQEFNMRARLGIRKKEISILVGQIESSLARVKNKKLEPYLYFEPNSFASLEHFNALEQEVLASAKELVVSNSFIEDDFASMLSKLEVLPERIETLFRSTVKHAINTCDDTKLLKELLEVVNC